MKILIITVEETVFLLPMWGKIIKAREEDLFSIIGIDKSWSTQSGLGFFAKFQTLITAAVLFLMHYGFCNTVKKIFYKAIKNLPFFAYNYESKCYSEFCARYGITFRSMRQPTNTKLLSVIHDFSPDIVLYQAPMKLDKEVLMAPPLGIISRHPSCLPKFKGCFPVFWAVLCKEKEIGVTIQKLNEYVDGGFILNQQSFLVDNFSLLSNIYKNTYEIGAKLFIDVLKKFSDSKDIVTLQNQFVACYYGWPRFKTVLKSIYLHLIKRKIVSLSKIFLS